VTDGGSIHSHQALTESGGALMLTDGPGWVDHSTDPIMGLFPLAVEQYLNAAVAVNAPGVTTVTTVARYYALHPLVADEASRRGLDTDQTINLLRRVEVVYALICMAHQNQGADHRGWYPDPHGRDRLLAALGQGAIDLDVTAGSGDGRYANARTGFLGPYLGSEVLLQLLGKGNLSPGPAYERDVVHASLGAVLDVANSSAALTLGDLAGFGHLCLCHATDSPDGELLAGRFAGRPEDIGTVAGNIGQVMRLFAVAMRNAEIGGQKDLGDFVMYSPVVTEHMQSTDIWLRWRGIRTRMASVDAWRQLFAHVCRQLADGPLTIQDLGDRLAAELPSGTVGAFVADLPAVADGSGAPLPAETEAATRPAPESYLATLALGARRLEALDVAGPVRLGLVGPPGHRFESEELSPQWVSNVLEDWRSSPMSEFARWLVRVMINRAHRVTMAKATLRSGRFTMPLRIVVQDELVWRLHGEATGEPPLRWGQLLSMGRQTGIFDFDGDNWRVGHRGHLLD